MVEIGSVISATVVRVEPHAVYLDYNGESVIVLAPEVSWLGRRPLHERVNIGENVNVLVLRYNYEKNEIVGSIRRLHPNQNPYRELARLDPGTILRGRVAAVYSDGINVELPNGARGAIANCETKLERGDLVNVKISGVEVDEGVLHLRLSRDDEYPTTSPSASSFVETPS